MWSTILLVGLGVLPIWLPGFCHGFHPLGLKDYSKTMTLGAESRCLQLYLSPQQLGTFEALGFENLSLRRVELRDHSSCDKSCLVAFQDAWDWQKDLLNGHLDRLSREKPSSQFAENTNDFDPLSSKTVDSVIMLEHEPVYTLGTASDEKFILTNTDEVPVIRMDRGGEVTFHGPGQLTVYPVLDLRGYRQDIHWYIRALEESVIIALSKAGIDRAVREEGVTGVWVDNFKVAAVGIKCCKWITQHGLAVNVETTCLKYFDGIIPCGLEGRDVGCVNQFLDQPLTVAEFASHMTDALKEVFQIEFFVSRRLR